MHSAFASINFLFVSAIEISFVYRLKLIIVPYVRYVFGQLVRNTEFIYSVFVQFNILNWNTSTFHAWQLNE